MLLVDEFSEHIMLYVNSVFDCLHIIRYLVSAKQLVVDNAPRQTDKMGIRQAPRQMEHRDQASSTSGGFISSAVYFLYVSSYALLYISSCLLLPLLLHRLVRLLGLLLLGLLRLLLDLEEAP